ncbi:MAG: BLUF domain-containing protein [Pseudomonadota bacterium]
MQLLLVATTIHRLLLRTHLEVCNRELIHCIYCSAAADRALTPAELEAILEQSRRNNAKRNMTGILLFDDGAFFQVLEGDRKAVDSLFKKLKTDTRHTRINKLISEPIEERSFGDWSMGYPKLTRAELEQIPGLNDFFVAGKSFIELEKGRAKTFLKSFKKGKWRF